MNVLFRNCFWLLGLVMATAACNGSQVETAPTPSPVVAQKLSPPTEDAGGKQQVTAPSVSAFTGNWVGTWKTDRGAMKSKLSVQVIGPNGEYTGVYTYWATAYQIQGAIQGNILTFDLGTAHFELTLDPDGRLQARRTVRGEPGGEGVFVRA